MGADPGVWLPGDGGGLVKGDGPTIGTGTGDGYGGSGCGAREIEDGADE